MTQQVREDRFAWARAHGWSYAPSASVAPDIVSGVFSRVDIDVDDDMRGMFAGRPAFMNQRQAYFGGSQPSQFFHSVSAVDSGVPVPRSFVLIGRDRWLWAWFDLKRRAYLAPHVRGLTHLVRPHGTHIWCEPAGVQALLWALAPILESPELPSPPGVRPRNRVLIASEGQTVYVCDEQSYDIESDLQRLQVAYDVGARYAQLAQRRVP